MAATRSPRLEPRRSSRDGSSPIRISRPSTLAADVLQLQRTAGNAAVGRLLARARDGSGLTARGSGPGSRLLARQVGTEPAPVGPWRGDPVGPSTAGSVKLEGDDWSWNVVHDPYSWLPDLPFSARGIAGLADEVVLKDDPPKLHGPLPAPHQAPWLKPPLDGMDKSNPIPWMSVRPGPVEAASLARPVGVFQSVDVPFDRNEPVGRRRLGATAAGTAALGRVIEMLQADPTLQVRLVGHASSDGRTALNMRVSMRRANAVYAVLRARGLGARVMDYVGSSDPPGGRRLRFGVWAAGESQAETGAARPEDRKVTVTFLRNHRSRPGPLRLGSGLQR